MTRSTLPAFQSLTGLYEPSAIQQLPDGRFLIVEDEVKTGEYLCKGLTEAGFVVDLADNGMTGYHLAMTADYDLIVLDIMLPDVNG